MIGKKLVFLFLILMSCNEPVEVRANKFHDIKRYFSEEINRLVKQKITINKTVRRNGISETRENIYPEWVTELSLFSESDINKPAWRDSYSIHSDSSGTLYSALDAKLRTRSIRIKKNKKGQVIEMSVLNRTSNYLYSSSEQLLYIPDSLYRIIKMQDVVLLGKNSYEITGIYN